MTTRIEKLDYALTKLRADMKTLQGELRVNLDIVLSNDKLKRMTDSWLRKEVDEQTDRFNRYQKLEIRLQAEYKLELNKLIDELLTNR